MAISGFVIFSLVVSLFYFIGFLTFITDHDENKCDMTYMFEYPQFVKIQMPEENQFRRYGLYAYSEGKLTEKARAMKFTGVPVLFVPGNAGSHKQVRSLASVALRKALNSRTDYHFDFFTIDLNGELSGLNGAVLEEQTKFLNHSLHRVLELYNQIKTNAPKSVIVIGHSMGGVIAHNLMQHTNHIDLLITLASPHKRSPLALDSYTADYYKQISNNYLNFSNFENKTVITVAGGTHDHLVHTALTNVNISSLNVVGTNIPTVWLSMDHTCITWCKQFILTIIRALFDTVDLKTEQLSTDHSTRLQAFRHHLLKNSGTNFRWSERYKVTTRLDDRGEWREDIRRRYSINLPKGSPSNQWHMIRLVDDPKHQALLVQAVNLALSDWIFACTADNVRGHSRYCENGIHLSHLSEIAPTSKFKRRIYYADLFRLKKRYPKISHVIIRLPPTNEPVSLNIDVHNPNDRLFTVQLPRWFSLSRTSVVSRTERDALRYEINLVGLQHVIQAYLLYVEPVECDSNMHHATASLHLPWAHHDTHTYITETSRKPMLLRLHNSRPSSKSNLTAKVRLLLDPSCQYTVTVRNSFIGMLGQFARFYSPLLVANIAAVILMSFRAQMLSLGRNGYCTLFQSSLCKSTKPYYLITFVKLVSASNLFLGIAMPDARILFSENMDFLILPLLLYLTAVGLTYLMSIALWAGILMNESTIHKLVGKFFTRAFGGFFKMSDWVVNAMHRVPCVVAVTLVCLGLSTCGGLALCLAVCYYFLKLTQLCQDYLEGLAYGYIKTVIFNLIRKVFKNFKKPKADKNAKKAETNDTIQQNKDEQALVLKTKQSLNEIIENNEPSTSKTKQCLDETSDEEISKDLEKQITNEDKTNDDKLIEDTEKINDNSDETTDFETQDENVLRKRIVKFDTNKDISCIEDISEDLVETPPDIVGQEDNDDSTANSELHFHFSLFLIVFLIMILNIPSVLTWAHNFQYNNVLRPDSSLYFGVTVCVAAILLWQFEYPKPNKKYYDLMSVFLYLMALLCLIYAPVSLYRLSYILTITVVVTILHQLVAPNKPEDQSQSSDSDTMSDVMELLNLIKSKLE